MELHTTRNARREPVLTELASLAGGVFLCVIGALAIHAIADAWGTVLEARQAYGRLIDGATWFVGDGSPLSRNAWDLDAILLSVLLGGGLVASGLYGVRIGLRSTGRLLGLR